MTALSDFDVLCGRTAESYGHPGNVRFREIVQRRRPEYRSATRRSDKNVITRQVIQFVHGHKGRFLRFDPHVGWTTLSDNDVYEKVSHALRGSVGSDKSTKPQSKRITARKKVKAKVAKPKPPPTSEAQSSHLAAAIEEKSYREVAVAQQSFFQALLQQHQLDSTLSKPITTSDLVVSSVSATSAPEMGRKRRRQQTPASHPHANPRALAVPSEDEFDLVGYDASSADEASSM